MPRHPDSSKLRGFTQTPADPRTRPLSEFTFAPPDPWSEVDDYMFHLSRDHNLKFDRGSHGVRLYNSAEVREARANCEETCGTGKPTAHQRELEAKVEEARKKRAKKKPPESTVVSTVVSASAPAPTTTYALIQPVPRREPKPKPALVSEQIAELCKKKGLVTSMQIAERYDKVSGRGNFMTKLKFAKLKPADQFSKSLLYLPSVVDEICAQLGVPVVKEDPAWEEAKQLIP